MACTVFWISLGLTVVMQAATIFRAPSAAATIGVVIGSLVSFAIGYLILRWVTRKLRAGRNWMRLLISALNVLGWLAVVLFIVQWGAMHVAGPLLSGLYNAHIPDAARATSLSVINAVVTVYIGIGGVALGELAEWSLPGTFTLLGVVILAGALLIRVDDRHAAP